MVVFFFFWEKRGGGGGGGGGGGDYYLKRTETERIPLETDYLPWYQWLSKKEKKTERTVEMMSWWICNNVLKSVSADARTNLQAKVMGKGSIRNKQVTSSHWQLLKHNRHIHRINNWLKWIMTKHYYVILSLLATWLMLFRNLQAPGNKHFTVAMEKDK